MILYRVKDWDQHFENNRSRVIKDARYVLVPNKMDGDGYTRLVEHENGAAHLGCWHVVTAIASKCRPRGTLVRDDGTPHTLESMARMSRLPARLFEDAVPRLVEIGWLEAVESIEHGTTMPEPSTLLPESGTKVPPTRQRMEWNGTEGNRTLPSGEDARAKRTRPRDLEEARNFWSEAKLNGLPEAFYDHFETTGWRTRQGPVKDWHAAARNWSRREGTFGGGRRSTASRDINPDVLVGKGSPTAVTESPPEILREPPFRILPGAETDIARELMRSGADPGAIRQAILERRQSA